MSSPTAPANQKQRFIETLHLCQLFTPEEIQGWLNQYEDEEPTRIASAMIKAGAITQFQAKQLLAGRHRGFFLGQYKILDQLGQGGMGAVYIAEHTTLRRKVAIKVLHKDKSRDQKALERFFREARAAAALDHANIVRLHDIAQGSGVHFLVMEYVDGVTLQHLLERAGAMHYTQAVQYAAQVTAGLQHAHEKGFVHRDIKPANLILEKGGVVKILDMGLARSYEKPEDNLTANFNENTVQGTVDYISPEQAVGGKVDHRSDIYSLGTTLYALITGHAPFAGTTAQKLMGHQMTDPPKLSKLRASVPPALNGVVARMMAKQPEKRFQSCSEVIEALAPWLPVETLNSVVRAPARSVLDDSKVTRTDRKKLATTKKLKKKPKPFWKKYAIHLGAAALGLLLTVVLLVSALNRVEDTNKPVVAKGNSSSLLQNRDDIIDDRNYALTTTRTLFKFEGSKLEPFNSEVEANGILPRVWPGWVANTWDPAVKGMYRTSAFDETLAIGVAGVGEKNAIQYAFRPHEARPVTKLVDGQRYQVQVTARSEENTTGSMNVQTMNDWQMITSVPMNTSKDRWQTFTLDFIKPAGKDIQITVAPNAANGKYLWIKSLTFEALEGGSTSATNNSNPPRDQSSTAGNNTPRTDTPPPATSFPLRGTLYTLDLKKEVLFSITKQGDDVVEGDGGMMQWWPVCEKGTKARFSVKELGAGRVFGMERLEGNGYIVFVLNLEDLLRNVPKGTSLQVEIEYTTQKEGQGELKMQHGVNYSTLISENLESSDERWTHVSMFYEHNPAEKPQLAFTTNRGGVYVKNLSLRVE